MNPDLLQRLRRRAHVHTDSCYGAYEPCGEHHVHDMKCGGRPLRCGLRSDSDLVALLAEYDRLVTVDRPHCSSGGCSRPAQLCKGCAKMLEDGAMHKAWDEGWAANQLKKQNPYPAPGLSHVCGLQGFGALGDVCDACVARTASYKSSV